MKKSSLIMRKKYSNAGNKCISTMPPILIDHEQFAFLRFPFYRSVFKSKNTRWKYILIIANEVMLVVLYTLCKGQLALQPHISISDF